MSGGPLYVTTDGVMQVAAVTVAGTDAPDQPLSDVRASRPPNRRSSPRRNTPTASSPAGTIKGPASVAAGTTAKFKTGVVFKDGVEERRDLPVRYDETFLKAVGPNKHSVAITKLQDRQIQGRFRRRPAPAAR